MSKDPDFTITEDDLVDESVEETEFEMKELEEPKAPKEEPAAEPEAELDIEVIDDTPEKDRNKKPAEPPAEVTDDELENYSEKVKKRIQHFSRGYHDERRAKEAAQREREEAIALAQKLVEENKKLKGSVNQNQTALIEQAKKSALVELEQAKRKYKDAYEAGDADAVVASQEELTSAKMKVERLANFKPQPLQVEENEVQIPQPAPQQPTVDPRAEEWRANNPWFNSDAEMTALALALHKKLIDSGVDPRSDEYYERIDARMRQVFPDQFGEVSKEEVKPKAKKPTVAGVTRSTAPKKIVLTQRQVALAKRLNVPLSEYAKMVAEEMRNENG